MDGSVEAAAEGNGGAMKRGGKTRWVGKETMASRWTRGVLEVEDNPGGVYDRETARMKTKYGLIGGKVYSYGCCG